MGACSWTTSTLSATRAGVALAADQYGSGSLVFLDTYNGSGPRISLLLVDRNGVSSPSSTFFHPFATPAPAFAPLAVSARDAAQIHYGSEYWSGGQGRFNVRCTGTCGGFEGWTPVLMDSTDTGIAWHYPNRSFTTPRPTIVFDRLVAYEPGGTPTAVWNVSTWAAPRIVYRMPPASLVSLTRSGTTWTPTTLTGVPNAADIVKLRAEPTTGRLATIGLATNQLTVRLQAMNWTPTLTIPLPSGARWQAKFVTEGTFHVVTSDSTNGTRLYTLQGASFASEVVSALSFDEVDFAFIDGQAVVAGSTNTQVTLFQ